jgi:hypothetical protein
MDYRQAVTILEEIARSTRDPRWKEALAYAIGHLSNHQVMNDDDDESQRLAAKFHIDAATYAKLKAIKGDETLAIVRLASRKDNPKGYVLTCIRNAEREVAEPITPSQMYDTFAPNHKLRIKVDEDDIREVTTNADGKVPRDVTRDITYEQDAKRQRAMKVRERLGIRSY